jgi:hypothetical protein
MQFHTLTIREDVSHFEVTGGEADDGRFVQLTGDGRRQRQQLGQLQKLCVFLLAATPRCIFALLLHPKCVGSKTMGIKTQKKRDALEFLRETPDPLTQT